MSWNLLAAVEQADHEKIVRPMILTRASRGITHSATVAVGDYIDFDGIQMKVTMITHKHTAPGDKRAPNSVAFAQPHRELFDDEIDILIRHGFEDAGQRKE